MFLRPVRVPNHTLRRRLVPVHSPCLPGRPETMLTEIYIEALLVDEELADQVWETWDAGEIDDGIGLLAWWMIAASI